MSSYSYVGSQDTWFGVLDTAGVLGGTTGTVAVGSDAGMGRLAGVQSIGLQIPEAREIPIPGDNGNKGVILIPAQDAPVGEIVTSVADLTFQAQAQSMVVRTLGNTEMQVLGPSCPTYKSMCILVNSPALIQTAGSVGVPGWHTYLFIKSQIQPRSGTIQNGSQADFSHKVIATFADKPFWGEALTVALWGTTKSLMLDLGVGAYPWTGHVLTQNTGVVTFTVDETPAGANGDDFLVWRNGTLLAYTTDYTVVAATKTVTLVAAGTVGQPLVSLYRYVPTC